MYEDVANRTGLKFRALVVHGAGRRSGRNRVSCARIWCSGGRVALETEKVDLVNHQQTWIDRAMRLVTGTATLSLHGRMFEYPRPLKISMALVADGVLFFGNAYGARHRAAVHVVAIGALEQALVDPVTEGFAEVSLLLGVAGVAELWLLLDQQASLFFRKVGRAARDAAHAVCRVGGTLEIGVLRF